MSLRYSAPSGLPGRHSLPYAATDSSVAADRACTDKRAPDGLRPGRHSLSYAATDSSVAADRVGKDKRALYGLPPGRHSRAPDVADTAILVRPRDPRDCKEMKPMADPIRMTDRGLDVPDHPVIPFIVCYGTGPAI